MQLKSINITDFINNRNNKIITESYRVKNKLYLMCQ